jgi:hypothetical protein
MEASAPNEFVKVSTSTGYNEGVYSREGYFEAYVSASPISTSSDVAFGISLAPVNDNSNVIDYAFELTSTGTVSIRELETLTPLPGLSYDTNTIFSLIHDGTHLRYFVNGSLQRTVAPEIAFLPLHFDSSYYSENSGLKHVSFGPTGRMGPSGPQGEPGLPGSDVITSGNTNSFAIYSDVTGISSFDALSWQAPFLRLKSSDTSTSVNFILQRDTYSGALGHGLTFSQHHEVADAVNFNFIRTRGSSTRLEAIRQGDDLIDIAFLTAYATSTLYTPANINIAIDNTATTFPTALYKFILTTGTSITPRVAAEILSSSTLKVDNIEGINYPTVNVGSGVRFGDGTAQTTAYARTTGSWTLSTGSNTVSFEVPQNGTYSMWVRGNIPNGIVVWNADATVSNSNVPAIGRQDAWYYETGNQLVFDSIPDQIISTAGTISTASGYAGTTSNVFAFGITNNSTSSQIVEWAYTRL